MIKNIIFDIGNVILKFNVKEVLKNFTSNEDEQKFILDNIINSPEWLGYALIDTGYITKEEAIEMVKDRTNHTNDKIIEDFWNNYNNFASVNEEMLRLIKTLKEKEYKNIEELENDIIEYIEYYNNRRIKSKLKGMSPVQYRKHSKLVA